MDISVTYDSSVSSAPAAFKTVVNSVVNYLDGLFGNPITVNIDVGWGEVNGSPVSALGESDFSYYTDLTYDQIKGALTSHAVTAASLQGAATLPAADPTQSGDYCVNFAEALALGLSTNSAVTCGSVGFNSSAAWDFEITNNGPATVPANQYDLFGVVAHEISEVLGRGGSLGSNGDYFPLDLFDYSAPGMRNLKGPKAGRYFSLDGGTSNLDPFNGLTTGDAFDWGAGAGDDAFDAFSGPGVVNAVSATDVSLMNMLGYEPTPDFTATSLSLSGAVLSFRINDISPGPAVGSTAGVYLSSTAKITTADTLLATVAAPTIVGGGFVGLSANLAFASTLAAGDYYVGVVADYDGGVIESNTKNDASTGLAIIIVGASNLGSINGVAGVHAFDAGGLTLTDAFTLDGSLTVSAVLRGAETMTVAGGDLTLDPGAELVTSAVTMTGAAAQANVRTSLSFAGALDEAAGTIAVSAGDDLSLTGADTLSGTLSGAGAVTFAGVATFGGGSRLTIAQATVSRSTTQVTAATNLTYAGRWAQTAGTVSVAAGDQLAFTGAGDLFAGTLAGAGTVALNGGSDSIDAATVSVANLAVNGAALTLVGATTLSGVMKADTANLIVGASATGVVDLAGGGTLLLASDASTVVRGAGIASMLRNVDDTIAGAGQLGDGQMLLVNAVGGTINGDDSNALVIDTGADVIANAGTIEATHGGSAVISSAVNNTGVLGALGGNLTVSGAVKGVGIVKISAGTAAFASTLTETVDFTGAEGVLELANSQTYTGAINGFSKTGSTSLDLGDISFVAGTTKATYSGTAAGGVLSLTDGKHTALIHLAGNYLASIWTLSSDSHGGTNVADPTTPAAATVSPSASVAGFAAAAASLGPASGEHTLVGEGWRDPLARLATPSLQRS